jgi:hypothetical protein
MGGGEEIMIVIIAGKEIEATHAIRVLCLDRKRCIILPDTKYSVDKIVGLHHTAYLFVGSYKKRKDFESLMCLIRVNNTGADMILMENL